MLSRIFPGRVCLPDVITLPVQKCPPVTEPPSGDRIALLVWWGRLVFGGFARIGRAVLNQEGGNVAKAVVVGWMCAWKFWVRGAVFASRPEIRKNALSFLRI